jgi:hypothetical protein
MSKTRDQNSDRAIAREESDHARQGSKAGDADHRDEASAKLVRPAAEEHRTARAPDQCGSDCEVIDRGGRLRTEPFRLKKVITGVKTIASR